MSMIEEMEVMTMTEDPERVSPQSPLLRRSTVSVVLSFIVIATFWIHVSTYIERCILSNRHIRYIMAAIPPPTAT